MKIVLADPILPRRGTMEINYPNAGILYLISYLRLHEPEHDVTYVSGKHPEKQYLSILKDIKPNMVGISFTTIGAPPAYETAEKIRKILPDCFIIGGGAHPTECPEEVLRHSAIDVCVRGEGERTMVDLVRHRRGELALSDVEGLAYLEDGDLKQTHNRRPIESLDDIPFPAWDLINFTEYNGPPLRKNQPATAMLSIRGCPYRCGFCSNPVWRVEKPYMRKRSPENIAREVTYLYDRGVREIYIRADEFNITEEWAVEVCNAIRKLNLTELAFQVNLTVFNVTDRLARALADINCWLAHIGIESANQRVLDGINKKQTVDEVVETCKKLKSHGIGVFGFFMMFQAWEEDNHLCFETTEEVRTTLKFIKSLVRDRLIDYISWQVATPLPGAPLYDVAKKYSLMPDTGDPAFPKDMRDFNLQLPGVSISDMKRLRLLGLLTQGYLAFRSGRINWKSVKAIKNKIKLFLRSI